MRVDRAGAGGRDDPHRARHGRRPRHPGQDRQASSSRSRSPRSSRRSSTQEKPGLVILGKQAIDDDCNQTGQMLAALLGWPQGTFASKIVIEGDSVSGDARGRRRPADREAQSCRRSSPPICASTSRATRRLPNIMKAKKKPIDEKTPGRLRRRRLAAARSRSRPPSRRAARPASRSRPSPSSSTSSRTRRE